MDNKWRLQGAGHGSTLSFVSEVLGAHWHSGQGQGQETSSLEGGGTLSAQSRCKDSDKLGTEEAGVAELPGCQQHP